MPLTIQRRYRDALHREAVLSFAEIDGALKRGDLEAFANLRPVAETLARLVDDLGWGPVCGQRWTFDLTIAPGMLAVALDHLAGRVEPIVLSRDAVGPERLEQASTVLLACQRLLRKTGPPPSVPQLTLLSEDEPPTVLGELVRPQRDLLHRAAWFDFLGEPSLTMLIDAGRIVEARRARFLREAQWRLMDNIGWPFEDRRERFSLRLSDLDAAAALSRIQLAAHGASDHTDHLARDPEAGRAHNEAVVQVCRHLLRQLPEEIVTAVSAPGWSR